MVQAAVVGLITGVFTAGTVWGILKTEISYMRRDIDRVHQHLGWGK